MIIITHDKEPIIDKCIGCDKVDGKFCSAYLFPHIKWRIGNCPLASHIKIELKKLAEILVKQALQENRIANVETRMLMEGQRVDSMENTFRKFLMNRREDGS